MSRTSLVSGILKHYGPKLTINKKKWFPLGKKIKYSTFNNYILINQPSPSCNSPLQIHADKTRSKVQTEFWQCSDFVWTSHVRLKRRNELRLSTAAWEFQPIVWKFLFKEQFQYWDHLIWVWFKNLLSCFLCFLHSTSFPHTNKHTLLLFSSEILVKDTKEESRRSVYNMLSSLLCFQLRIHQCLGVSIHYPFGPIQIPYPLNSFLGLTPLVRKRVEKWRGNNRREDKRGQGRRRS